MPTTSIIVPVYNVEDYLEKCVHSILAQTEPNFELLLIDDGSTDRSGEFCDRLAQQDERVRVIHQENRGLGGARNTGIEAATGDYLLFIDSDDTLQPQTLERALTAAKTATAEIAIFGYQTVNEQGDVLSVYPETLPGTVFSPAEKKDVFFLSPCAWNKLYARDLFLRTGIRYPSRVWYEDIRTTLKLYAQTDRVVGVDYIGYNYLQRPGSIMNSGNLQRNLEIIDAFDDLLAWFHKTQLFSVYEAELRYLAVFHIYFTASIRVLRAAQADRTLARKELLPKFAAYTEEKFPGFQKSFPLARLSRQQQLLWHLLIHRQYAIIKLLFKLKG